MGRRKGLVFGVGVNDADHVVFKMSKEHRFDCPYYTKWKSMLERCYSERWVKKHTSYSGCYVCDEWLVFSNFKRWMTSQDWVGKSLDKDILSCGVKMYSPETCAFITAELNSFLKDNRAIYGDRLTGAHYSKRHKKYQSMCSDGSGNLIHLGYFPSELAAHEAWKKCKRILAKNLAENQNDERVKLALCGMFI